MTAVTAESKAGKEGLMRSHLGARVRKISNLTGLRIKHGN